MHYINKIKDKNYIIGSIDVEGAFEKIQNNFMIKILNKLIIKGNIFKLTNGYHEEPTARIIFNSE